jgi:DNA-binding MarR family transcriptional regulator
MEWNNLIEKISKNISYWSSYVSRKTVLEKEDVYQDLTIILWKQYCKNTKEEKDTTVYYMQKRLEFGAYRLISNSYKNYQETTEFIDEVYYSIKDKDIFHSKYVKEIFEELKETLLNDKEFKALDILMMILEGKRNKEISKELNIKSSTLSIYIKRKIKEQLKNIVKQNEDNYVIRI